MRASLKLRPIPGKWRSAESWVLLALLLGIWAAARLLSPGPAGGLLSLELLPACPFRSWTSLPCPLCGLTTAATLLARGRWADAWRHSVLSPLLGAAWICAAVYVAVSRLLGGRALALEADRPARRGLGWALAGILAISWIVNLSRALR